MDEHSQIARSPDRHSDAGAGAGTLTRTCFRQPAFIASCPLAPGNHTTPPSASVSLRHCGHTTASVNLLDTATTDRQRTQCTARSPPPHALFSTTLGAGVGLVLQRGSATPSCRRSGYTSLARAR
eukprot:3646702-Rhodomonas_salina.3